MMSLPTTQTDALLGKAHIWLSRLADEEFDFLRLLAAEYGPALRHVARGIQVSRNAPQAVDLARID
jgi:hypothetical protein